MIYLTVCWFVPEDEAVSSWSPETGLNHLQYDGNNPLMLYFEPDDKKRSHGAGHD